MYKSDLRKAVTRKTRATRLGSLLLQDNDVSIIERNHIINLTVDLLELKFYIPNVKDNLGVSKNEDNHNASKVMGNNLLAVRVKANAENGLDAYPNLYKPESSDPIRQWIVIELCTQGDLDDIRNMMLVDSTLSAFVTEESQVTPKELKLYCRALWKDDDIQDQQAHPTNSVSIANFLEGKAEDDVLLVYPFGADPKMIDKASVGLQELSCVLEYENGILEYEHDATDQFHLPRNENEMQSSTNKENEEVTLDTTATNDDALGEDESRAVQIFSASTIERLEEGVYLNDTLIDFWLQWVWRNADKSDIHYFTTLFYTTLEKNDADSVTRWTEKRGVDIFTKKFIFIPINKSFHWSLCVVINPGAIIKHKKLLSNDSDKNDDNIPSSDDPFPCLLHFDSLLAHSASAVSGRVRKWLNSEWRRLRSHHLDQAPFNSKSLVIYSPEIPYQDNCWDCGVYVCRYAYALYQLRSHRFTYDEVGFTEGPIAMFRDLMTQNDAFHFGAKDITRIRREFFQLIERLSKLYFPWKGDDDRKRLEARRLKKIEGTAVTTELI
jgi:hypothetical protein